MVLPHAGSVGRERRPRFLENTRVPRCRSRSKGARCACPSSPASRAIPVDGEDGNTLVQRAEAALKQAKESGEQYLHYQIQMHSELAERLALEHRLRIALDEKQFVLLLPAAGQCGDRPHRGRRGAAALARSRRRGSWRPARFLPVLESSGMIVAGRRLGPAQGRGGLPPLAAAAASGPVRVAVNVSALQMRRRTFVDSVLKAAPAGRREGYGVDIEITETGLLQDLEGTSRKLRELRNVGHAHRHRRFRHRLFLARAAVQAAGRPAEDRPRLHQRPARRSARA